MASSNAIAAGGGGGVSWQADIPGLASMALTLGAAGLKRLAQAGVDFHTIVCMSEIAEKCPASNEYRRELSECRQAQRKEAQWLYKVVELGAATNFVADELLKKRAGENVVALLSAVLTVMSEKSCDNLLLRLFEAAGSDLDSTPGFAQLRSFRESMAPLAKRTKFKDRVFQYYMFSRHLLHHDTNNPGRHVYDSIPNEETAVQVILALSKLTLEDSGLVLDYHRLSGSGWVIANARHVLGLPVCILSSPSNAVPISGDYHTARVFVHIYDADGECKLLVQGQVQDFFVTKPLDFSERSGWQIDVGTTNVLDTHIPRSDPMRNFCVDIARSLTHDYTEELAKRFETSLMDPLLHDIGLKRYSVYHLSRLRQRAQRILTSFGFEESDGTDLRYEHWTQFFSIVHCAVPETTQTADTTTSPRPSLWAADLEPTPRWVERRSGEIRTSDDDLRQFDEREIRYLAFLFRLTEAASFLAFTDWDQNVRLLSTNFIDSGPARFSSLLFNVPIVRVINESPDLNLKMPNQEEKQIPMVFRWSMNDLCKVAGEIILGKGEKLRDLREKSLLVSLISPPVAAISALQGLSLACRLLLLSFQIVPRRVEGEDADSECSLGFPPRWYSIRSQCSTKTHLSSRRRFLHVLCGSIIARGEQKTSISTSDEPRTPHRKRLKPATIRPLKPRDMFPGISLPFHVDTTGKEIYLVQQHALINDKICPVMACRYASESLSQLYVTDPCEHDYYAEYIDTDHSFQRISNVIQALWLVGREDKPPCRQVWLQAVDQSSLGQWVAFQTFGGGGKYLTILQRDCCIACALQMVESLLKMIGINRYAAIRIIHGYLEEEEPKA